MIWAPPSFLPRSITSPTSHSLSQERTMCSWPSRTFPVSWLKGPNERYIQDSRCKHHTSTECPHPSWHIVARATHRMLLFFISRSYEFWATSTCLAWEKRRKEEEDGGGRGDRLEEIILPLPKYTSGQSELCLGPASCMSQYICCH